MTPTDFILVIPELFQLILINIFLLYALFFSGTFEGQSNQKLSVEAAIHAPYQPEQKGLSKTGQLPILQRHEPSTHLLVPSKHQLIRSAYLPTPLQIVEPLSWLICLSLLLSVTLFANTPSSSAIILTNSFILDPFATFFKILICLSSAFSLALAIPSLKLGAGSRIHNYEFLLIIYLAILGMLCLISSYNFLTFYLSIELQSLSFYLLACSKPRSEFSAEAGLKYFILGAFSSAILLFGISLIYGSIGSIYFDDVAALLDFVKNQTIVLSAESFQDGQSTPVLIGGVQPFIEESKAAGSMMVGFQRATPYIGMIIGLVCILISLLFKLAAAPFHMWAPDVYEGSPMGITAFFAITAKIAALAVLARLVLMTDQLLVPILSFVTVASLIVGTLSAMRQVKIKRLIAFSGISNVGWFLLGLCCGRLDAVILHLVVYIVLSITLFSIIIQPIHRIRSTGYENTTIKHISDLSQIYKTNTMVAFALTLTFFSLGGIPFLAGFYSKYLIINAAIQAEALGLLSISLVSAVFSAFYYIRVVKTVYFAKNSLESARSEAIDWFSLEAPSAKNAYLIALTSLFTGVFVIYPECVSIWLIDITI